MLEAKKNKGELKYKLMYEPISVLTHYRHIIAIYLLFLGGGFFVFLLDGSLPFLFIGGGTSICVSILWWFRLKKENSFPFFFVFENGLEIHFPSSKDVRWYTWDNLVEIQLVSPFDRCSKGLLSFIEGRPGIELSFSDRTKFMVYQRIIGYFDLYQYLVLRGIKGGVDRLPIYDRLNIYGQSIDGSKCSFNNNGEPASYKNVFKSEDLFKT